MGVRCFFSVQPLCSLRLCGVRIREFAALILKQICCTSESIIRRRQTYHRLPFSNQTEFAF